MPDQFIEGALGEPNLKVREGRLAAPQPLIVLALALSELGIGAFAYYRRFVDSHKDKIIDKIHAVAVAQNAGPDVLAALDRAKSTNSFDRAVGEIKEAIPPGLRLKGGRNPLTVLYKALSVGVHEADDPDCLQRAQDIRTVLTALAEKTTQALQDSKELDAAVGRLLSRGKASP